MIEVTKESTSTPTEDSPKEQQVIYSYSSLKDHTICPARNYFKKLAREKLIQEDVNLPAIFGSAIHKGIEMRLKKGSDPYQAAEEDVHKEIDKVSYHDFTSKEYKEKVELLNVCINNFESDFYKDLNQIITDPESQVEISLEMPYRKGKLVGKVDVALPEILADWKTGAVPRNDFDVLHNSQAYFYYRLAQYSSLGAPKLFEYVYLQGKNIAYHVPKRSRTGKAVVDKENPDWKFSWPVFPTQALVEEKFRNTIDPIARSFETGIIYKNKSYWNCKGCKYRTACGDFNLPEVIEDGK